MVDDAYRSRRDAPGTNASDAHSLKQRIADMEQRLALERVQVVAHSRAWRGNVRRRVTSPTSLFLAGGLGFIAAEIFAARSRTAASRSGAGKPQGSLLKSVLGGIGKPLLSMMQLGSLGFLAKQSHDVKSTMETSAAPADASPYSEPPTLH